MTLDVIILTEPTSKTSPAVGVKSIRNPLMAKATEAAANYLRKDSRINIRLSGPDLKLLKRRAAEEGIPYQTLIASVLHKFVTGWIKDAA